MIPLYPPRQGDPHIRLVKWRSLVHLVSHTHNEHEEEAPRVRSLSTIVFMPSSRKHSTTSQQALSTHKKSEVRPSSLERRRPSAPSLTDLRRFLPDIIHHRSRSSSNVLGDAEPKPLNVQKGVEALPSTSTTSQRAEAFCVGAKNKVQRLKAGKEVAVAGKDSTKANFFKKKDRKLVVQSSIVVASNSAVHGVDEKTLLIAPVEFSGHAKQSRSTEQSIICAEVATVVNTQPDRPVQAQEDPVIVVVDPSTLQADSSAKAFRSAPNPVVGTEQRSFSANLSAPGQEETGHPTADSRLPPKALYSTDFGPQDLGNRGTLLTSTGPQPPLTSSFHSQTSAHLAFASNTLGCLGTVRLQHAHHRHSFPLLIRDCKWRNNIGSFTRPHKPHPNSCSFHRRPRDQYSPEATELFRRHSLPDMAIAAYGMVICGGSDELEHKYRGRIEKVKFGVPVEEAFSSHEIPATLLVLLLKVNKEGPLKKDIWRAPGNQAQVRKLSHIMQHGRIINISNISVYTSASVIKKFLSKLPGGIFGPENEQLLFNGLKPNATEEGDQIFYRVICSLPVPSQHLLVLLFGTFRIIADSAQTFNTRMTPDAIGISVAPSLFHTCIADEHRAKLEDVMRFKLASQVISKIIQCFGYTNLFPRECYEFYARITGRKLGVVIEGAQSLFSFTYPSRTFSQPSICFGQTASSEAVEDQPGPSGFRQQEPSTSRRRSDESEGGDFYGEELPGTSRFAHPRRDRAASASGAADPQLQHTGYWRHPSKDPFSDLMTQRQLSTSMGEVLLHSEYERAIGESLSDRPSGQPSPHSAAAMSSRFLSPLMPQKNNGASKSFDFHSHFQHSPSPMHQRLKLPDTDTELSLQSSTEEIGSSHSSSIKEQRPLSPIMIVESSLEPMVKKVEEMGVLSGETTPRLPFQLLQHHSGDDISAPLSTPPARHQPPVFFAEDAPPAKTPKSSSSSSGSQSQKSILVGPSSASTQQQSNTGLTRVSSIGVVRRKSWRTHYVRPNKSLDQESAPKEQLNATSSSTPAASTRRSSANGDTSGKSGQERGGLMRRKSSNSTQQSSKVTVQARRSTQI